MAELRRRFESHGFDDNGNDTSSKLYEKVLNKLLSDYDDVKKAFKEQAKINKQLADIQNEQRKQDLGKALADLPKNMTEAIVNGTAKVGKGVANVGKQALGSAVEGTIQGGASVLEAGLAMSGPVGYALARTLNLGKMASSTIGAFKQGWSGKTGTLSDNGSKLTSESKGNGFTKLDKNNFESLPTIKLWQAYMKSSAESNISFRKYLRRWEKKFNVDEKSQKTIEKALKKTEENTAQSALEAKTIMAGVAIGVSALVGLAIVGFGIYEAIKYKFGDKTNTPSKMGEVSREAGAYGKPWDSHMSISSGYGHREAVRDSKGKIVSPAGEHHGQDWTAEEGDPVLADVPGIAYPRMQIKGQSGFEDYKFDKKDTRQFDGYGIFVDLFLLPVTAAKLGYEGKQVIFRYAHLRKPAVTKGQRVAQNNVIGYAGHTGRGSGTHVHFEILVNGVVTGSGNLKSWALTEEGKLEQWYNLDPSKATVLSEGKYVTPFEHQKQQAKLAKPTSSPKLMTKEQQKESFKQSQETQTNIESYQGGGGGNYSDYSNVDLFDRDNGTATGGAASIESYQGGGGGNYSDYSNVDLFDRDNGTATGGAASIESYGLTDSKLADMNLAYSRSRKQNGGGYVGTLPNITQNIQSQQKDTTTYNLNFDTQNDSAKALKTADKSLDFTKY